MSAVIARQARAAAKGRVDESNVASDLLHYSAVRLSDAQRTL
ncbi:hypothetical protein M728_004099 (plasmid) [Ensifer sp. WSM1721]|nr:hypothetical protein [Ensifer sp. WSM1721]